MAQLIQPFNAHNVDPTQSVGQLPVGKHPVIIESSEVKGTKANDGGLVEFRLKIIDGPSVGTTGSYRLNLYHSNPQTVEIANRQLSALCHVTGVFMLQDTAALHNIPFIVEVATQRPTREQEDQIKQGHQVSLYTEVKRVYDINGNEPGKQGQNQGAAQPQQQAAFRQPQQQAPQQGQQQPQQQAAGGWAAPASDQTAPSQQAPQNGGSSWGAPTGQAAPQQQPAQGGFQPPQGGAQPAAGGWQQGGAASGPAWGQR